MDLHSQPQVVLYGLLVRYIAYANDPSSQVTNTITTEQQQQSPAKDVCLAFLWECPEKNVTICEFLEICDGAQKKM